MGIVDYFRIPKRSWYWYRNAYANTPPPEWPTAARKIPGREQASVATMAPPWLNPSSSTLEVSMQRSASTASLTNLRLPTGGRRLAAAMALFAAADVPLVYLSVNLWRGLHPNTKTVSSLAPGMRLPFFFSLAIFSALWGVLLALRMRVERAQARLVDLALAVEDAEGRSS